MPRLSNLLPELESKIAAEATAAGVPGMAVAVACDGESAVVTHGVTNIEHPLPVDGRTLFQIGSTTKTVTATAVMRLVEDGRLALDAPVTTYLPEFRVASAEDTERITLQHLLTHTGGWAGDWFLLSSPDYGREGALAQVVADMWKAPQLLSPGAAFSYNNAGFYVLGRLVEAVTGDAYPDAMRRLVLEPVGLSHSYFHADEMITHRVAAGHTIGDAGAKVQRPWPRPFFGWPAGALCSCAEDQLRWAEFWFGDGTGASGERILKAETMAAMTTPQTTIDSRSSMGLGWMLRSPSGVRVVYHGGTTNGYLSVFAMAPDERFMVAVLSNSSSAGAANKHVEQWVFERVLGVERDPDPSTDMSTAPAALAAYAGRYGLGGDIEWSHSVAAEDGRLVLVPGSPGAQGAAPYRFALTGPDEVTCLEPDAAKGSRGTFGRAADGTVAWFRFGLRVYKRIPD